MAHPESGTSGYSAELRRRYDSAYPALLSSYNPVEIVEAMNLLLPYSREFKGLISELRAKFVLGRIPIVQEVRKSRIPEDINHDIDFWVSFKDEIFPLTPVQIKNSKKEVKGFRQKAEEKGLRVIALNCGHKASMQEIAAEFLKELVLLYNPKDIDNSD